MTTGPAVACQVVPDIASFSVDDGFMYRLPPDHVVGVGSRVRVRVGGRRMRGFVTALFDAQPERDLVEIDGVVGTYRSFDEDRLQLLRWAAEHYIAPVATVLRRTVPPNVARGRTPALQPVHNPGSEPITYHVGASPHLEAMQDAVSASPPDGTVVVVAPTVVEVEDIAEALAGMTNRDVRTAHSGLAGKDVTSTWQAAVARQGTILVGTREIGLWSVPAASQWIIVEDARRVMRSPATPTISVRTVAIERHRRFGTRTTFLGPMPSLETIHAGARVITSAGRQWPLVEVLDRGDEPPGSSVLLEATRGAITGAVRDGGKVFVLVPRRGHAGAEQCIQCRELRRCRVCGSAAFTDGACLRCEEPMDACTSCGGRLWRPLGAGIGVVVQDLRRLLGDRVGRAGEGRAVTVGTERDLLQTKGMALAVAVDVDGMALAPHYRAREDALRTLIRLAQTVERGRGHRCVIQTSEPHQSVVSALRAGTSGDFLAIEAGIRRRSQFPPFGDLIALEVADVEGADGVVRQAVETMATVHGPAPVGDRDRWLITGTNLGSARLALRHAVGTLRDRGGRVRIDVDPIDL